MVRIRCFPSYRFGSIKKVLHGKLGFELSEMKNPDAVIFKFQGEDASFAIRRPLEDIENRERGVGISVWFSINEGIEDFAKQIEANGVKVLGGIMDTPFGKALHVKDLDGYKLTFLQKR